MTSEEKNFIRTINIDKAKNRMLTAIGLSILSISTYIIPIMLRNFDFGIIFEGMSLLFMIISIIFMGKYNESKAKTCTIIAMCAMGWLVVYDFLIFLSNPYFIITNNILYYLLEFILLIILIMQFNAYRSLAKAENSEKYKESTDWFYENYNRK